MKYCVRLSPISFRALAALLFFAMLAVAQDDQNPNSPTPVLLSTPDSAQLLAVKPVRTARSLTAHPSFTRNSKGVLYVTNIQLMKGEDYTAFRIYAEDGMRHIYRFPVVGLEPVNKSGEVFSITFEVRDELGVWDVPARGELN